MLFLCGWFALLVVKKTSEHQMGITTIVDLTADADDVRWRAFLRELQFTPTHIVFRIETPEAEVMTWLRAQSEQYHSIAYMQRYGLMVFRDYDPALEFFLRFG